MASQTIDILLNPVIDKGRFSAVVESLKTGSGIINIPASITTDKAGFDGVVKASEQGGKQAGEKFSDTFKVGYKSLTSGLDTLTKNALSPILSVFGGNLLTKGFSSIVGGFGDWIEKGKGVLATTNAMQTAFAQTGKSGKDLDKAIADTNKVAGKLSNQFAMSVADVREYSKAAAVLGGATGKSNEDLTKLGIAIEKSTNGMVSGTMAIRLFSKGVSDPESEFALARLTKQYPALGAALKGIKEPAEVTAKALSFFGPTFKTMEEQSKGALGSFTILQNNLNAVKTAFGSVIIEAIAPFASSFAQTIVPAVQAFTGYIKGFAGYLKPLAPLFVAVGSAAATMVGSLLAMQGVNYLGGLITQGIQFSQTILTKVLPSLFAQTTAEGALVFSTEALTVAEIKKRASDALSASIAKSKLLYMQLTNKSIGESLGLSNLLSISNLKENASNLASSASTAAKAGATGLLGLAKSGLLAIQNALTLSNIKDVALSGLQVAWTVAKTVAMSPLIAAQMALNAAMLANPVGLVIAGAVALGGALYLLYDNVESVRNIFDTAWNVISVGASTAWEVIKVGASVIGEIGSLVFEVVTAPFQLTWSVISGIGSAIGSLVGSFLGITDAGALLQSVFTGIQQAGQVAIDIFNTVKATIAGITGAVGAFTDSIADGIGKVFSLDLGGAWDSFTGAGDKAAQAFNDKFNDKMRTANFESAAKSIEKGLESAKDIEVKVKAKTDFQDTLKSYEETQKKIDELSSKPKSSLTANQVKELEVLKLKAAEYSTQIQKIAPATVNSMSAVVGANGQLTTSYDINIAKAKEFGKANDYTQSLNNQKQAVSKSISDMTTNYASQEDVVKKMKNELEKPITNKEEYAKLQTSFTEASQKAEEMKTQLIDNFTKAGAAGMLTDDAIKGVAKSLKTTEQEAKKMLLVAELKKLKDSGLETEEAIAKIGDKYGYTKEQAKQVANESANQTKNVKETKEEVKNLSEAWDSVVNSIKGASESSKKQFVSASSYLELMKKNPALAKKMYDSASAEAKAMFDMLMKMGDAEAKNYIANGLAKAKTDKQDVEQVNKIIEQQNEKVDGKKKETSESKKATAEAKSQYEILKDSLAIKEQELQSQKDNAILLRDENRLKLGLAVTTRQTNLDKLSELDLEKEVLELKRKNTIELISQVSTGIKDKEKQIAETKRLNEELDKTNKSIKKIGNDKLEINAKLGLDSSQIKNEISQIESDTQRLQLEADVKLKKVNSTELDLFDLNKLNSDRDKIIKEIDEIRNKISENKANNLDYSDLEKELTTKQSLITKSDVDIYAKQQELEDKRSRDRISSIADTVTRERELKIYELKKTYDEEIYLAQGNAQKLLVINQAYADNRNKIEQDYLAKTSFSYNALTKLSTAFANIKVGSVDRSEIVNLNKTKSDLSKERQELENSYAVGKTDYESYQKSLSDIQNKESENRIAIEEAEAERRKAIWSGFTTAVSGYFGTMYDEYSKKASESVNAVIQSQDTEYRIKQEKALANSALQASIENNNYLMQATMKAKLTELDNQDLANKTANSKALDAMYFNLATSAGMMFGQLMTDNESFGKAFVKTALSTLKALVPIISAQILGYSLATPDSIASFGVTGLLKHAALTAILYGAVSLAESAVSGAFRNGVVNFQGKGTGTSDSNLVKISHGESVMTAKATANPINQKFFNYANKGGDLVSFLQTDKDIQRQLAQQRIMQSYESVSKQKEMFDRIVADYNNTNKQLKEQNRELVNEIRTMKNELVEVFKSKVLIESKQSIRVDATNNIINKIEPKTLFARK